MINLMRVRLFRDSPAYPAKSKTNDKTRFLGRRLGFQEPGKRYGMVFHGENRRKKERGRKNMEL
jgi:hypothetical protein